MSRLGVMQVVDTLDAGGAERVAVNLANSLPRDRYHTHLCTTRRDGVLGAAIDADVGRLALGRQRTLDLPALLRLRSYLRDHEIRVLHAHGTALFFSTLVGLTTHVKLIWHDHCGRCLTEGRSAWPYLWPAHRTQRIISVTEPLAAWARDQLHVSANRVCYLPNFVVDNDARPATGLPGVKGKRIVCVANLRPEKDHVTLVRAMAAVLQRAPEAHLILIGSPSDQATTKTIEQVVAELQIAANVTLLGQRSDVAAILRACDIGVLSSSTEGLPLALIEYGMAGLAGVATQVGQCGDVLEHGAVGHLVPIRDPAALAAALLDLLSDEDRRRALATRFEARVRATYSMEAILPRICAIYDEISR